MGDWGLYAHVPWCRRRCPYCAFYVEVDRETPWDAFVEALLVEYAARRPAFDGPAATVFLGGGTPSRMPVPALSRLLAGLDRVDDAEVTAEVNPEDLDGDWLDGAVAAGVNRVSLGVQTLDPRFARLLNRACTVEQAAQMARRVRSSGVRSWSVDLIFGLPGQSLADLTVDLERLLDLVPPHVALYGLTIEPGTAFERGVRRGRLTPADPDLWREMYDLIVDRLGRDGIVRYEVSNFARDGHRSAHNRLYWTDAPYMGLGPSAHGFWPDGRRYANVADRARWLAAPSTSAEEETPTPEQAAIDRLISGLRGVDGVPLAALAARSGRVPDPRHVAALVRRGLLVDDPKVLRLTSEGFPVCDGVVERLIDTLLPVGTVGVEPRVVAAGPGAVD